MQYKILGFNYFAKSKSHRQGFYRWIGLLFRNPQHFIMPNVMSHLINTMSVFSIN